jgi:hypothetical protein
MDLFGQPGTEEEAAAIGAWASVITAATESAARQEANGEARLPCTEIVAAHMWCMARFLALHPQIKTHEDAVDAGLAMGIELTGLILATKAAMRAMGVPKHYRVEERDGPANEAPACHVPKNKQH